MDLEENQEIGTLYCLDSELNLEEKVKNVKVSNGPAWSLDNKSIYYIDSSTKEFLVFDYDLEKAEIKGLESVKFDYKI